MLKQCFGIYQGIVTNTKDPEKRGRIKVKCPEVLGDTVSSAWCDPCVPIAYDNGGDFCIPQLNETVWIMFISGDVNKPVYLGGWWSKDRTPLGVNYSNTDLRIINYADCTLLFENGKIKMNVHDGDCELEIAQGKITLRNDKAIIEKNLEVSGEEITIKNKVIVEGEVTIKNNVTIEGDISVSGNISCNNLTCNTINGQVPKFYS